MERDLVISQVPFAEIYANAASEPVVCSDMLVQFYVGGEVIAYAGQQRKYLPRLRDGKVAGHSVDDIVVCIVNGTEMEGMIQCNERTGAAYTSYQAKLTLYKLGAVTAEHVLPAPSRR